MSEADDNYIELHGDFNGCWGDLLCLSHDEDCWDAKCEEKIVLYAGMMAKAIDEDVDENGEPDDIFATGIVEPSPDWLQCRGSRWILRIDEKGVRHMSDLNNE